MFCLGGIFNALRFSIVMKRDVQGYEREHERNPLLALLLGDDDDNHNNDSSGVNNTTSADYGSMANNENDKEVSYSKDTDTNEACNPL